MLCLHVDTEPSRILQQSDLPRSNDRNMVCVYVTGAAGFIGSHTVHALAKSGLRVSGCDLPDVMSRPLQQGRLKALAKPVGVDVVGLDVCDTDGLTDAFRRAPADIVIHLAALAGVRSSAEHPLAYAQANLIGFTSVLEACRRAKVRRLLYASSSSVYGNRGGQFAESDRTGPPTSYYAATKIANEAMASAYRLQMGLNSTGLRFFTVYGPWGRPDMAPYIFARAIHTGTAIKLFGRGQPRRDFTYIKDVVEVVCRLVQAPLNSPLPDVLNVGQSRPVRLLEFVNLLERAMDRTAKLEMHPLPPDDVVYTCADDRLLSQVVGPLAHTPMRQGLADLARWVKAWESIQSCPPASTS